MVVTFSKKDDSEKGGLKEASDVKKSKKPAKSKDNDEPVGKNKINTTANKKKKEKSPENNVKKIGNNNKDKSNDKEGEEKIAVREIGVKKLSKKKKKKQQEARRRKLAAQLFVPDTYEPCVHLHFKLENIDRECLTTEQYFEMLATPKGYRWAGEVDCNNPKLAINKAKKKKAKLKQKQGGGSSTNFVQMEAGDGKREEEKFCDVMTPEITNHLIDFLVNEFGMPYEEAEDFVYFVQETCATKQPLVKKKKPKRYTSVYNWVEEYSEYISKLLDQYLNALLKKKRTPRVQKIAQVIVDRICDLIKENISITNPKKKSHRVLVHIADRIALWIDDIYKAERKKKTEEIPSSDTETEEEPSTEESKKDEKPKKKPKEKKDDKKKDDEKKEEEKKKEPEKKKEKEGKKKKDSEKKKDKEPEKKEEEKEPEKEEDKEADKEEKKESKKKEEEPEKKDEEKEPKKEEKEPEKEDEKNDEKKEEKEPEKKSETEDKDEAEKKEEKKKDSQKKDSEKKEEEEEKKEEEEKEKKELKEKDEEEEEEEEEEEGEEEKEDTKPSEPKEIKEDKKDDSKKEEIPEKKSDKEIKKKSSVEIPLKIPKTVFEVKPQTESQYHVQKLSSGTVAEVTAKVRGVEAPQRRRKIPGTNSPLNLKSAEDWADWAENIGTMADEWGKWLESRLTEAEKQILDKHRSKSHWQEWRDQGYEEALKWRVEEERIKEEGKMWKKKIDEKLKEKSETEIKNTDYQR